MPRKVKDIQYDEFDPNFKKIVAREKILNNKEFCKDCKCFAANSKMCKTILQRNKCSRWKKYTKKYKNKCTHCGIIINNHLALGGHIVACRKNPNYFARIKKISMTETGMKKNFKKKFNRELYKQKMKARYQEDKRIKKNDIVVIKIDDKDIDLPIY